MSPEQIQGAVDLGPRADLYSLGVSLYEMVTRTRPFQGDSDYSIMAAHLNSQPVPPIQIDPTLPSVLSDIILMAIAKDPDHRFQTADAFRKALESVEDQFRSAGSITKVIDGPMPSGTTAPLKPATPPPPAAAQPVPAEKSSRRGLYMAIGSLVTVGVLAVAALQGPKWFRGSEAASVTPPPQQQQQAQTIEISPRRRSLSSSAPRANDTGRNLYPSAGHCGTRCKENRTDAAYCSSEYPDPAGATGAGPTGSVQADTTQIRHPSRRRRQHRKHPTVDPAKVNALRELREHMMMLGSRANSARATLTRMKEEQARQGLGMRGDILTAEQRMENYMDDAEAALRAGDPERAKKALQTAEREIDKIDSFLGR